MTEKNHPNTINRISNNDLIDSNYNQLIEINGNYSCDDCEENLINKKTDLFSDRNIVIAKSRGLLGIHFCENCKNLRLDINDCIIIKHNNEFEFATIIETGQMVDFKREKSDCDEDKILPIIERIANEKDQDRNLTNIQNSTEAKSVFLKLINELSLEMKLVDIHYQFDRKKLFFFYTADGRVDFRELAKRLAANFKTRISLRQIGM